MRAAVLILLLAGSLAAVAVAAVSVFRAFAAGASPLAAAWDTLRLFRSAPPAARPHLRRALLALGVFVALQVAEALVSGLWPAG